jgi:predicted ATPase
MRAAIGQPGVRLVTLAGPGGIGKTRLALAAAASLSTAFPHGLYFVALAAVGDAEVMWKSLADSLDVSVDGPAADAVTGYLAGRRALLVLDNLERVEADDAADGARRRHAEYYAAFAERMSEQIDGPGGLTALDRLEADHDNLRAAMAWSLETSAADPGGRGEGPSSACGWSRL